MVNNAESMEAKITAIVKATQEIFDFSEVEKRVILLEIAILSYPPEERLKYWQEIDVLMTSRDKRETLFYDVTRNAIVTSESTKVN
jgi:hypothetical protein